MITIPIPSLDSSVAYFSIVKESLGRMRNGQLDGVTVFVYSCTVWPNIRKGSIIAKKKIKEKNCENFLVFSAWLLVSYKLSQIFPELRFSTGNIRNESRDLIEIDKSNDAWFTYQLWKEQEWQIPWTAKFTIALLFSDQSILLYVPNILDERKRQ